jgi:hypothetical protein
MCRVPDPVESALSYRGKEVGRRVSRLVYSRHTLLFQMDPVNIEWEIR